MGGAGDAAGAAPDSFGAAMNLPEADLARGGLLAVSACFGAGSFRAGSFRTGFSEVGCFEAVTRVTP